MTKTKTKKPPPNKKERPKSKALNAELVATLVQNLPPQMPTTEIPADNHLALAEVDPWTGLNDQQKVIQTLALQGASQASIGKALGISQPRVGHILKAVREIHKKNGASLEAEAYVGETRSLFQTIEQQGWKILREAQVAKNTAVQIQALQMIKGARIDQTKMLLDIGMLEKQAEKVQHTVEVKRSIVDDWTPEQRAKAAGAIMESQLTALPAPTPPEEDDEDTQDAEFEEV